MENPTEGTAAPSVAPAEESVQRAESASRPQEGGGSAAADTMAAHFEELAGAMGPEGSAPLSTLYDLMLPVAIELGRTAMSVQEVLHLGRGAVIELDRLAGEPVDVYVGDRRFAEGEVVVLGENFGVRITRILPVAGGDGA